MRTRAKILSAGFNNRRREFDMELTDRGASTLPYHRADPPPTRDDPVRDLYIDPELGNEGVTYVLESGAEGSILADHVRDFHRDPSYMRDLLLYQLSVEAHARFETSPLSIRAVGRRLKTSPAQIYRLLDQTNYTKTVDRMLELLQVLDATVELRIS